jgi:predicted esterase
MNVPVFIVHDEKDMNVPIAATRDLMEKLASVGAHVVARIKPDKGYESPGMEGIEAFKKWAMDIVNGRGL